MTIDESFDELYKLLRGSRCAAPLLDARGLFDSGNVSEAIHEVQRIQQLYEASRKSTLATDVDALNLADKESNQLKKRHDKASDALELMKGLRALLTLHLRRVTPAQQPEPLTAQNQATVASHHAPTHVPATMTPEDRLRSELSKATSEQDVRDILGQFNELVSIPLDHAFAAGQRFVIFSSGKGHVVEIDEPPIESNSLRLVTWPDRKRLQPIPLDKFHQSVARGRVLKVESNPATNTVDQPKNNPPPSSTTSEVDANSTPANKPGEPEELVSDTADRDKILDMGAFTQLLDASQRSGIVPGSGMIIQVRDCEYRLGKYNKALQMMETLYTSFMGAETQRMQRLQREEAEISSGRKKMSQRDLQAKRIKDNQDTQAIDRTKVRFQRVLEGLRGLLHLERVVEEE